MAVARVDRARLTQTFYVTRRELVRRGSTWVYKPLTHTAYWHIPMNYTEYFKAGDVMTISNAGGPAGDDSTLH